MVSAKVAKTLVRNALIALPNVQRAKEGSYKTLLAWSNAQLECTALLTSRFVSSVIHHALSAKETPSTAHNAKRPLCCSRPRVSPLARKDITTDQVSASFVNRHACRVSIKLPVSPASHLYTCTGSRAIWSALTAVMHPLLITMSVSVALQIAACVLPYPALLSAQTALLVTSYRTVLAALHAQPTASPIQSNDAAISVQHRVLPAQLTSTDATRVSSAIASSWHRTYATISVRKATTMMRTMSAQPACLLVMNARIKQPA